MSEQSRPLSLIALPGNEPLTHALTEQLGATEVKLEYRRFPDGESYLRLPDTLNDHDVVLVASLDRPDRKTPSVLFAADLARDLGAQRIGLVCPYLAYMRQDIRFHPGEALTSRTFARWLSTHLDWLVTVDPHLHRYRTLDEIYTLDSEVVASAPALSEWIVDSVDRPLVIGPDGESEQWVRAVAEPADLPWRVMTKTRFGDRDVGLEAPDLSELEGHTPVLVDDIISSGGTMAEATRLLLEAGFRAPVVVVAHGLFGARSRELLRHAGVARVVCTNSVNAPESEIGLSKLLVPAIERLARAR